MVTRGGNENLSFEEAIDKEQERTTKDYKLMENDPSYFSENYFRHAYLDRGIYVDKIKRWMDVFPRDQFLIIQSEKFFEDPSKYYDDVLNFLNVPSINFEEYGITGKVNTKSPIESQIRKKLIDFFKPHNQRLYKFLEMKFEWDE